MGGRLAGTSIDYVGWRAVTGSISVAGPSALAVPVGQADGAMRRCDMRALLVIPLLFLLATPAAAADEQPTDQAADTSWYVALGDSIAAGWETVGPPERDQRTTSAYPDQLWLMARSGYPDLQLLDLSCPGENTETIRLDNGRCAYEHGSQLALIPRYRYPKMQPLLTLPCLHCFGYVEHGWQIDAAAGETGIQGLHYRC